MTKKSVTVDQWVEMFRAIGLEESQMHSWHAEFERRFPDGHQGFLEWLELSPERIAGIRERSGTEA